MNSKRKENGAGYFDITWTWITIFIWYEKTKEIKYNKM